MCVFLNNQGWDVWLLCGNPMSCLLFHYSGNNWFCVGKKDLRPSACWDKRCHSWSTLGVSKFGPTNRSVVVTCSFNVTLFSVTVIHLRFGRSWASTQQPVVLVFGKGIGSSSVRIFKNMSAKNYFISSEEGQNAILLDRQAWRLGK